ncbi:MAG: hypothetical protein K8S97_12860, partial [Anaerolineae bacterium]|nr:hypothetical protein [Anaerolineae bacterium]
YVESAASANAALAATGPVPDLLTIVGLDYCNMENYAEAEAAYDWALNVAGRLGMPQEQLTFTRLLRVDVLLKQGKTSAAAQDVAFVSMAGANPALVERFHSGEIGCENFFGAAAMLTSGPTTEFEMVIDPNAVDSLTPPEADTPNDLTADIAPVAPDETMVLVAEIENVGSAGPHERDVARFIADDLRETLEDAAPFSNIAIRQYPGIITSDEEARAIAEQVGAAVIVWGNYTADLIELEVQIGSLDPFPYNGFEREDLERMANVRIRMTNERTTSAAYNVLTVLSVLHNADANGFEMMRISAIADVIDVQHATIVGSGVSAHTQRHFTASNAEEGAQVIQTAIALDPGNALLYVYSSVINQRLGQIDAAMRDIDTAKRLGPAGWTMPLLFEAALVEDETVLAIFDEIIAARPDDWFPLFFRGSIYYNAGRAAPQALPLARADLEASMALDPPTNFPYIYAALLALHEGRLQDAGALIDMIVTEFPDPSFLDRLIAATFGNSNLSPYSVTLSAFVNQTLGRHEVVIETTQVGVEQFPQDTDLYVIQAISYCALGDHEEAEAAFTTALEQAPTFMLLYLLRGAERFALGDAAGAEADLEIIADSPQAGVYGPFVNAVEAGELTCANFLAPDGPMTNLASAAPEPGTPAAAVEPVSLDEPYMVLVAAFEPLAGVETRDVARFVLDDLERRIEDEIPYSQVAVRAYPAVIMSEDEAAAVAEEVGATVVVWGNYGTDVIELMITPGTLDAFPYNTFERDIIEQVTNVRVHLTTERRQSVAQEVAGVLALLALADGDEYQWTLNMLILDTLDVTPGEIQGSSTAAYTHRAMQHYFGDTPAAIDLFDEAIAHAGGNALLYAFRSMTHLRAGDVDGFTADIETATRLGPELWTMPMYAVEFESYDAAQETYLTMVELRPDDWFVRFLLGMVYYNGLGDLDAAQAALEDSFANQPEANLPYVTAMFIALRQNDIAAAQTYAEIILTEFPDPDLTNRAIEVVYGGNDEDGNITGLYFEAGTNIILGQYGDVEQSITAVLDVIFGTQVDLDLGAALVDEDVLALSDIYFMQGVAYCNLDDAEAALEAYSQAIRFGDFPAAHVMRAQMYRTQLDTAHADADFAAAREMAGEDFELWVAAAESGAWTCENVLEYQPVAE